MKKETLIVPYKLLLILPLLLLALAGCDDGAISGALVWEDEHVVEAGDSLQGQLLVLGGEVVVQEGARVTGSIYLLGGAVEMRGEVQEDVAMIGGVLILGPSAVLGGDLSLGGGELERSPEAVVQGEVLTGADMEVGLDTLFPRRTAAEQLAQLLPQALLVAVLAYLLVRFLPGPVIRVCRATVRHPFVCAAMGLLIGIAGPSLLVLIAFTIILIPVALIGLLLVVLVVAYGWIGLGLALGQWLRQRLQQTWSLSVCAFVGTLLFMAGTSLLALVPVIGGWIGILAGVVGVGAVFLTRFGLCEFVPSYDFGPPAGPVTARKV